MTCCESDIQESENIASLHNQITACDAVLEVSNHALGPLISQSADHGHGLQDDSLGHLPQAGTVRVTFRMISAAAFVVAAVTNVVICLCCTFFLITHYSHSWIGTRDFT